MAAIVQAQGTVLVRRKPAFEPPLRHHHALVAKRQTQPPQKRPPPRHGGSNPPGCTNIRSLRQAAKASVQHTDFPRFESWSEPHMRFVGLAAKAPARHTGDPRFKSATKHHRLFCSSMAERPADSRKTAVRYRAGEPSTQTGDHHDQHQHQTGAAGRRHPRDGPGAFKPETVGQRAFNPRARGSTPPGSSNRTVTHTRLAQSVERRPLKSEVRGSSPRSCTNSLFDLRRICRGGPAVYGLRRVRFPCRSPASITFAAVTTKGGLA